MKNDIYLTLEKSDLNISDDLEFSDEPEYIEAYIDTYFDVDKKFGLNTSADDSAWVNMYARYNPFENTLLIDYIISSDKESVARTYQPTDYETNMISKLIEEACVMQMNVSCKDALIRDFMAEADDKTLVCEKISDNEYQIRNTWGDFILYKEDASGQLKDHVGHEIEYATYDTDDDYSFSIECLDCNEVLLAQVEPDEIVEDIEVEYLYGDYRIVIMPNYKKALNTGDVPPDLYCEVYSIKDAEFENSFGEFDLMPGFEYTEYTVESIEDAIKKMMDDSISFYELQRREAEFNRADELLARSISYIAELSDAEDLREILVEKLDMTEMEADSMMESFEPEMEADQGMTFG